MALHNLSLNRRRSALSMIGIVIAIMGVLVMGVIGSSGKKMIYEEIKTFGLQTIWIYRDTQQLIPGQEVIGGTGIDFKDCQSLLGFSEWIGAVSGVIERNHLISQGNKQVLGHILYVEPSYFSIENDTLIQGRYFNQQDIDFSRRVCVIGQETLANLFGIENALGKTISIADSDYEIIGVLAKKDRDILKSIGVGGQNPNGRVLIPLSIALLQSDTQAIDYIQLSARNTADSDKAAHDALQWLDRNHHGQFSYTYVAMNNYIQSFSRISRAISLVLVLSVAISLIVGGIGIANVMTIAVVERTKEIGIRKSIGATQTDIFMLFLMESVLLTSVAGLIGVGLGSILGLFGLLVLPGSFVFPMGFVGLGVGIAVITGIVSGVYPAMNAAKKKPVEALRDE